LSRWDDIPHVDGLPDGKPVTFFSDGVRLKGDLYVPEDLAPGEVRGAIVVCQGFATATGGKNFSALPHFARHFAKAGYVALKFDYRGFGESEGERWYLRPMEQVADIRNAITYLETLDCVDPGAISLFGTSFGGSNVVYAAGIDERVRAVVSNVPVGNGKDWLRGLRENWQWEELLEALEADRRERVLTGESKRVPRTFVQWCSQPMTTGLAQGLEDEEGFCNSLPLETAEKVIEYAPEEVVARIAPRPILFIGADGDITTPFDGAQKLYDHALAPKRLLRMTGTKDHQGVYESPYVELITDAALAWYEEHVPARTTPSLISLVAEEPLS
jgi:uncharacterized protein